MATCQPTQMQNEHPLAAWRKTKGKSQEDFAVDIGVSRWMVNSIETGRRKPSLDLALKIQDMTKIAPSDLIVSVTTDEAPVSEDAA